MKSIPGDEAGIAAAMGYVLRENSQIMPRLRLVGASNENHEALLIERQRDKPTDLVQVRWHGQQEQGWLTNLDKAKKSQVYVRLCALAREHLRACDVEGSFSGTTDSEWSRYRDSQQAILNSLAETQRTAITELNRRSLEAEQAAHAKYERLEQELNAEFETFKSRYEQEHSKRMKELAERDTALKAKEESFNTREPRYVARQEQQKQIDDIKKWLNEWTLTKGTKDKRWPVTGAYVIGLFVTAAFAIWFGRQNFDLLRDQNLASIVWWQWLLLVLKTVLPFAAFTTFLIYFIRWSSAWARQHAEEEFRNRSRLLDIGRSAWLLEAVRDAQDNNRELPTDLMKELARNLFTTSHGLDGGDLHPKALGDHLLHGLASIRVKSPDGSEVEATRDKKAK